MPSAARSRIYLAVELCLIFVALPAVLTLAGGLLFAVTYHRTESAFAAAVEHAIYGCFIITLGLGRFVYSGNG